MEMDVCWKEYFRDEARYADVINGIGCGGQQLVRGEDLQEVDSQTILGRWFRVLGKSNRVRIRDMVRKVAFGVNFAIMGIENQEMLDWTGLPEKLKGFVADYPIHVIKIREFEHTEVFRTDVKQVFDFIRCSGDKETLAELVQKNVEYQTMEEDAYEVVTQYVKAEELIQVKDEYRGKDGKVDMCQALKELIEDGRAEGRASGLADGREEATRNIVIRMVKKGKADEEIMELTECSAALIREIRNDMGK